MEHSRWSLKSGVRTLSVVAVPEEAALRIRRIVADNCNLKIAVNMVCFPETGSQLVVGNREIHPLCASSSFSLSQQQPLVPKEPPQGILSRQERWSLEEPLLLKLELTQHLVLLNLLWPNQGL